MLVRSTIALALLFACQRAQAERDYEIEKGLESCTNLLTHARMIAKNDSFKGCCEALKEMSLTPESPDVYKQCDLPGPDQSLECEHSECILKKTGVMAADGTIDFKQMDMKYEEVAKQNPIAKKIADRAKQECSEKNMALIKRDDTCLANHFSSCLVLSVIYECPKWNTESEICNAISEKATTCKGAMEKLQAKGK